MAMAQFVVSGVRKERFHSVHFSDLGKEGALDTSLRNF